MSGSLLDVDPTTGQRRGFASETGVGLDPGLLQAVLNAPRDRSNQPGLFRSGLNVGWQTMVGSGGSALEALGRATGLDPVEQYGRGVADYRARRAQEVGRSDLETAPWREGGASVLPWLGYNVAQQIPNFATMAAAFLVGGPGGAAAAGARGFGLRAGLNATASALGTTPGAVLAGATMLPQAAGSMYREAVESARATTGDQAARPSVGEALAALGLSPVYAAAETIPTARVLNIARGAGMGAGAAGRLGRAARGAVEGAATELVTEGVQTGMEQAFRPDLTLGQRAANVVDGALTGMAVGGVMGGGAGLLSRRATQNIRQQDAASTSTEDLAAAVDQALNPTSMSAPAAAVAAQPDLFGAPTWQRPVEGDVRDSGGDPTAEAIPTSAQPSAAMREFPLDLPQMSDNPLLAEAAPALPIERSRDPDAGMGREIALDTPNIIRQALQSAGESVRDNQEFRRFIGQFQAQDEVGLAREVAERLNGRRPTKRLLALAEGLGFFDRKGQSRNFEAEMAAARGEAQAALAAQDATAAQAVARKIEGIQRAARIQTALAEPVARPEAVAAPAAPPMTEMPVAAARQAVAEAAAQPAEQVMSALPLEWDRPTPPPAAPEIAAQPAAVPPIDPARMTTTPGPAPNEALAAWAKQPRIAAAIMEGNPVVTRMAEVATIAGVKKQDATLARKWLERFEERGVIPPDQQASAERLLARIYQAGGADAVQVGSAAGVDVRQSAQDGPQVGEGDSEGQGTSAARAEEAPATQQQAVAAGFDPTEAGYKAYLRDRARQKREIAQQAAARGDTEFAARQTALAAETDAALRDAEARSTAVPQGVTTSPAPVLEGGSSSPAPSTAASPSPAQPAPVAPVQLTAEQTRFLRDRLADPVLSSRAKDAVQAALANPTAATVQEARLAVRAGYAQRLEQAKADKRTAARMQARREAVVKAVSAADRALLERAKKLTSRLGDDARAAQEAIDRAEDDAPARVADVAERYRRSAGITGGDSDITLTRLREPLPTRRGVLAAAVSGALGSTARAQTARAIDVLKTGDIAGALDVLAEQSPSPQLRALAQRLAPLMGEVEVRIVEVGKDYPPGYIHPSLHSAYGLVSHNPATGRTTMHIRVDPGAPDVTNTTDETIVHEAIHAAIMSRLGSLSSYGAFMATGDARDVYRFRDGHQQRPGDQHILQLLRLWSSLANGVVNRNDWRNLARQHAWLREAASTPDEFITYALTSPQFQDWMKQQTLNNEGYWTRFVRAVGGFLGFGARRPTYLEAILDASNAMFDVLGQRQQGPTEQFTRQRRSEIGTGEITFARLAPAIAAAERAAASLASQAQALLAQAQGGMARNQSVSTWMRAQTLYLTTLNHIARTYGRLFPVTEGFTQTVDGAQTLLENVANINRRRATISAKFAELFAPTWSAYERLSESASEDLRWLMEIAAYEIDPRKTWDQHPWLHKEPAAEKLKAHVAEANQRYARMRILRDGQRASDVFDNMALYNRMQRYASMTTLVHNATVSDPDFRETLPEGFRDDPMAEFLTASSQVQNSLSDAHDFWKGAFERKLAAAEALWRQQWEADRNKNNGDPATWTRLPADKAPYNDAASEPKVNTLAKMLRDMRANAEGLHKHPYFHLGRVGEYFASFNIKQPTERKKGSRPGAPDQAAAERVSQALVDAGFDDFTIPTDAERANVFLRVETPDQLANLLAVLRRLEADGAIEGGTIKRGHRDEQSGIAAADAKFLDEAVSRFRTSPAFDPPEGTAKGSPEWAAAEAMRKRAVDQLRETWLSMLPNTSEARVMTQRKVVSGWSRNMMNSYAFRANVGNLALANLSTSAQMQTTLNEMRRQLRDAEGSDAPLPDTLARQQVLQEVLARETNRPMHTGKDWVDSFRAVNYAYFLGMSPAYALNNMTQVSVTLWPELAKKHGFVASAKEIARSTAMAIRVMRAALKAGWATSARAAAEPDITQQVLADANVPQEMQAYLMRLVNTGVVDIGGAARELGRLAERNTSKKLDGVLRFAGAFGLYSEAAIRLASGMALYNLEKAKQGAKFDSAALVPDAVRLIDDTMFNYTEANVGRALGRTGIAGRFTPVAMAFQQFNAQMLEKLVREFDNALGAKREGETDAQRAERRRDGRRFLAGHMAAITVLAGSLGLPGVTAIAAAVNALKDLLDDDDEPFDLVASWRNFLADVLGKEVGEVVARGLPRAIGVDASTRLGEQDIIPFSRFMADRRKLEDAAPDLALRVMGAPFSMVSNVLIGAREMAEGNILAGMQRALPTAVRSPVAAFRLTENGFTNPEGVRLPIDDPGVSAVLAQALGYRPAAQAEYQEANFAQQQRRGIITRDAARIRSQLMTALEKGDREEALELITRARDFDRNNPTYAILPRLGMAMQARQVARARADALDVPLGVSMRDVAAQARTAYANY